MEYTVKNIPSKEAQLKAMAEGNLYELLTKYVEDPLRVDVRKYLTISKSDLVNYLKTNKTDVGRIYREFPCRSDIHDVPCIEENQNGYEVSWLDHGRKCFTKSYRTMEEAAAVFLLSQIGMSTE